MKTPMQRNFWLDVLMLLLLALLMPGLAQAQEGVPDLKDPTAPAAITVTAANGQSDIRITWSPPPYGGIDTCRHTSYSVQLKRNNEVVQVQQAGASGWWWDVIWVDRVDGITGTSYDYRHAQGGDVRYTALVRSYSNACNRYSAPSSLERRLPKRPNHSHQGW